MISKCKQIKLTILFLDPRVGEMKRICIIIVPKGENIPSPLRNVLKIVNDMNKDSLISV